MIGDDAGTGDGWDFPELELSEPERMWLEAVYEEFREGNEIVARLLKHELRDKLPDDFSPYEIDARLVGAGSRITLLGIWHVDPKSRFIEQTDKFFQYLHHRAVTERRPGEIAATEIAEELGTSVDDLSRCYDLTRTLDIHLGGQASGQGEGKLFRLNKINLDHREALQKLADYPGLELWMRDFAATTDPAGPQPMEPAQIFSDESRQAEKSGFRRFAEAFNLSFWFVNVDTGEAIDAVLSFFRRDR